MFTSDMTSKIDALNEDIWSSMVNISLKSREKDGNNQRTGEVATSIVQIVGSWNGAVRIDMDGDLARNATASLIGVTTDEVQPNDIKDAVGELGNMTGGGVKELLPQPSSISLPTVVMGTDFRFSIPQAVVVYRTEFETEFGRFSVTVIQGMGGRKRA
jgi:chemotaxis protein CheX